MEPEPAIRPHGTAERDRRKASRGCAALMVAAAVALLVAACGETGLPTPTTTGTPASPAPTAVPTAAGSTDPLQPSAAPGPPVAIGVGFADHPDGALSGTLGTWSWDDAGDAAPWIVPRDGGRVAPAAAIPVEFAPPRAPTDWIARWARAEESGAGLPLETAEGAGPVVVVAPTGAGTWSLQLDARFAQGRGATWYWRVEVMP